MKCRTFSPNKYTKCLKKVYKHFNICKENVNQHLQNFITYKRIYRHHFIVLSLPNLKLMFTRNYVGM